MAVRGFDVVGVFINYIHGLLPADLILWFVFVYSEWMNGCNQTA